MSSTLRTEDLGKIFEMAICLVYNTPYSGPYRYSIESAEELVPRLAALPNLLPFCTHTAQRGARYDFTTPTDSHLSAKTSKRATGKVAPQVIGQSKPETFCSLVGVVFVDIPTLKLCIQSTIVDLLPRFIEYTFDCPNIYYNKACNTIRYIQLTTPIDWTSYEYEWTRSAEVWSNSSTLKVKTPTGTRALMEFQFHNTSRSNMAIRWCYDALLEIFHENFTIQVL